MANIIESNIETAINGLEAVQKVKQAHFEGNYTYGLIFMDCSMPIMDGYESTDLIRQFNKNHKIQQPKIIACTGHTEQEFVKKAWRYQMDEIIPKPANVEAIKELLQEMIYPNANLNWNKLLTVNQE